MANCIDPVQVPPSQLKHLAANRPVGFMVFQCLLAKDRRKNTPLQSVHSMGIFTENASSRLPPSRPPRTVPRLSQLLLFE
jgi:hypothetical protein